MASNISSTAAVDQRPQQRAGVERIADADLRVSLDQPLGEPRRDAALHNDAAGGRAALAGRADRAE
jgi:hypothetical protein